MSQLRAFAPWIAYPIGSALFGWQAGAAMALACCMVGLVVEGRPAVPDTFRVAALGLFGGLTVRDDVDPASRCASVRPCADSCNARGRCGHVDRCRPSVHGSVREAGCAARVLGHNAVRAHQRGAHGGVGRELRDDRRDHRNHAHGRASRRRHPDRSAGCWGSSCRCGSPVGTRQGTRPLRDRVADSASAGRSAAWKRPSIRTGAFWMPSASSG